MPEKEKKSGLRVSWEAEEYVTYDKNAGWYIGLSIVCIALVVDILIIAFDITQFIIIANNI